MYFEKVPFSTYLIGTASVKILNGEILLVVQLSQLFRNISNSILQGDVSQCENIERVCTLKPVELLSNRYSHHSCLVQMVDKCINSVFVSVI